MFESKEWDRLKIYRKGEIVRVEECGFISVFGKDSGFGYPGDNIGKFPPENLGYWHKLVKVKG